MAYLVARNPCSWQICLVRMTDVVLTSKIPEKISYVCSVVSALIGATVLAGWILDEASLRGLGWPVLQMKANEAVGFLAAGIALWCELPVSSRWKPVGAVLAVFLILLGAATLLQWVFSTDFGIDQGLFTEPNTDPRLAPGRILPASSLNFILAGLALLLLNWQTKNGHCPAQFFAFIGAVAPVQVLVAYSHGPESLLLVGHYPYLTQMSPQTALAWLAFSIGVLCARPNCGFVKRVFADTHSAAFLRRLLPLAIAIPMTLAWFISIGEAYSLYHPGFGSSVLTLSCIFLMGTMIWQSGARLSKFESALASEQTKLHRSNLSLRQSQARLRLIVEHAPHAVAMFDNEMRYLIVSQKWLADYRLENRDILGRCHYDIFPEIPLRWRAIHQSALRGNLESAEEDRFERKSGRLQWLRWQVRPWFDDDGRVAGILIFSEDITARKEVEEQLKEQAQKLAKINEELEEYAFVVSHDLKEPLRTVANFVQLISRDHQGRLGAKTDQSIKFINDATGRMYRLIDDLLEYSRAGRNNSPVNLVDCNAIAQSVLRDLSDTVRRSDADIHVAPLPSVTADPIEVTQLFQNLIGNAIKYRSSRPLRLEIDAEKQGGLICFSFRDNGIGIDPRFHEKIFALFQRLHGRDQYSGTGIGLALCRRIVLRYGGRIWVESAPESGSTFYFTLPSCQ